jgi:hypothetical protein
MTDAMRAALEWLNKRGGDGSVQGWNADARNRQRGYGQGVLAAGEMAKVHWTTWKKLAELGLVEVYSAGKGRRIRIVASEARHG